MLKHIVMWKLKEFAEGKTKAENALIMKESLERIVFQKVCKSFLFSSLQIYSFLIK